MNESFKYLDELHDAIANPTNGIVGVVDNVLMVCSKHHLELDWRAAQCRVRLVGIDKEDVIDAPLRASVFRAILARVATLCSQHSPDSFSPYGGDGEFFIGSDSKCVVQASWMNTLQEQRLMLKSLGVSHDIQKEAASTSN